MSAKFSVRQADWDKEQGLLYQIRHEVFVVGQNVPAELEWDGNDADCLHVIAFDEQDQAIGCGRLLPDGHIGRMAVRQSWRGNGVGGALLACLCDLARIRGDAGVMLNAQVHAIPFYARHGFVEYGDCFEEAGILHRAMEKMLNLRA